MVKVPTTPFDPTEYIRTPEEAALYLSSALESHDAGVIAAALGDIARAAGTSDLARQTGISRASLYSALREGGNPTLGTVLKLLDVMGIELTARAKAA